MDGTCGEVRVRPIVVHASDALNGSHVANETYLQLMPGPEHLCVDYGAMGYHCPPEVMIG
eukprot:1895133-Prymnesium_polylepis.1